MCDLRARSGWRLERSAMKSGSHAPSHTTTRHRRSNIPRNGLGGSSLTSSTSPATTPSIAFGWRRTAASRATRGCGRAISLCTALPHCWPVHCAGRECVRCNCVPLISFCRATDGDKGQAEQAFAPGTPREKDAGGAQGGPAHALQYAGAGTQRRQAAGIFLLPYAPVGLHFVVRVELRQAMDNTKPPVYALVPLARW